MSVHCCVPLKDVAASLKRCGQGKKKKRKKKILVPWTDAGGGNSNKQHKADCQRKSVRWGMSILTISERSTNNFNEQED